MRLSQNHHFDLLDASFIRFGWNALAVTPSVVCFTPNSQGDNNDEFVAVPIVRILMTTKLKSIFIEA